MCIFCVSYIIAAFERLSIDKDILILVERKYVDGTCVFSSTRISINGIKIRTVSRAKIHNILN